MKIILALSNNRLICESIRATMPNTDLVLIEPSIEDGLRRLISIVADVILIDENPSLTLESIQEVKLSAPNTPVILLAVQSNAESMAAYLQAGVTECITKPFDVEELENAVSRCAASSIPVNQEPQQTFHQETQHHAALAQHQLALRWMSRTMAYLGDSNRLLQSLLETLIDIFTPARASILIQSEGAIRISKSHGVPENVVNSLTLHFTDGLMRRMEAQSSLIDRSTTNLDNQADKEMAALGAQLAMPLLNEGNVCGAIILGEKSSGLNYSLEERELITMLAQCTSSFLERSKKYQDVARQQHRLNAVLSNITAGVVTVRPDNTISMMNDSAEEILQIKAKNVLGQSILKLGSAFADVVLRTFAEGKPRLRQVIQDRSINAKLGLSVTPLGTEGVVVIFSLIPGEDETEENLPVYSPLWEYLSSRIAQEIKNPMVPINTYAQLLPTKYDSSEFRNDFSDVVLQSIERINDVVDAIYDFSRHPRLNLEKFDLHDNIQSILRTLSSSLTENKIRVETVFTIEALEVEADIEMFQRAVENVITNAIEAMADGGTLTISTDHDSHFHRIKIADTGKGISEKDASRIFMPFYSTRENGMGLGLTMAYRIMKEHNGELELRSNDSGGSTFILSIPKGSTSSTKPAVREASLAVPFPHPQSN
jgi:nitrogen-specific signal transduction histidine kinase/DNA-binding NarL/FixJ family response regulator